MATLVEETKQKFRARLKELKPYLDEAQEIEQALAALGERPEVAQTRTRRRRAGSRPSASSGSRARASRGQRRQEMVDFLRDNPEATPSAAARQLGIGSSQASNLLRKLKADRVVSQRNGRWTVKA